MRGSQILTENSYSLKSIYLELNTNKVFFFLSVKSAEMQALAITEHKLHNRVIEQPKATFHILKGNRQTQNY